MIKLLLGREQLIGDLDDWVIVSERFWILIARKLIGDVHFLLMLHLEHELLLNQGLLLQNGLDVEHIVEISNTQHELAFIEFCRDLHFVKLVPDHDSP